MLVPAARRGPEAWVRDHQGGDAVLLLKDLVASDPFDLSRRCPRWLRDAFLLIQPARLLEETLVEVAGDLSLGPPESSVEDWLVERIERSARRILHRDAAALERGESLPSERHLFLSESFGTPRGEELRAAVRFNALPTPVRRAFFRAVVDRAPLRELARDLRADLADAAEMVSEGLLALAAIPEEDRAQVIWELMESATLGGDPR